MSSISSAYDDIHRYKPARESTTAAIAIILPTVIEIVFMFLFTYGFTSDWGLVDTENMLSGGILTVVFIGLALISALYRKGFLPDIITVGKWRRKWEDLYVRERDVDGVTVSSDDAWEQVKCTIYPYYKR